MCSSLRPRMAVKLCSGINEFALEGWGAHWVPEQPQSSYENSHLIKREKN